MSGRLRGYQATRQVRRVKLQKAVDLIEGYLLQLQKEGYGPGELNPAFAALYYVHRIALKARDE